MLRKNIDTLFGRKAYHCKLPHPPPPPPPSPSLPTPCFTVFFSVHTYCIGGDVVNSKIIFNIIQFYLYTWLFSQKTDCVSVYYHEVSIFYHITLPVWQHSCVSVSQYSPYPWSYIHAISSPFSVVYERALLIICEIVSLQNLIWKFVLCCSCPLYTVLKQVFMIIEYNYYSQVTAFILLITYTAIPTHRNRFVRSQSPPPPWCGNHAIHFDLLSRKLLARV